MERNNKEDAVVCVAQQDWVQHDSLFECRLDEPLQFLWWSLTPINAQAGRRMATALQSEA